jgi:hypothetical protein
VQSTTGSHPHPPEALPAAVGQAPAGAASPRPCTTPSSVVRVASTRSMGGRRPGSLCQQASATKMYSCRVRRRREGRRGGGGWRRLLQGPLMPTEFCDIQLYLHLSACESARCLTNTSGCQQASSAEINSGPVYSKPGDQRVVLLGESPPPPHTHTLPPHHPPAVCRVARAPGAGPLPTLLPSAPLIKQPLPLSMHPSPQHMSAPAVCRVARGRA